MSVSPTSNLEPPSVRLAYSIASSSPHSGKYVPQNIVEDKPMDQSSRWSGAFQGNASQWITLELESLSILKTITFGKFSKSHPCNMKELKVFVGTTADHMTEVLHTGLKNDSIPETFYLNYVNDAGVVYPTRYVKIVPLMAHGQNFHISIWHVNLTGISEQDYVERTRQAYEEYRETSVMRYVLKHLRQRRLLTPFQTILSRASIQLEHPLITQLYDSIVLQGDWSRAEQLLEQISSAGLYDAYLQSCQAFAIWNRLTGTDADGDMPPARGGHAMCIDPINEMIYIFGGWNGEKSLDDLWVYSIPEDKWRLLSHSTTQEHNAPGARSCHKMVFDTKTGSIYVLGRLNDSDELREPNSWVRLRGATGPGYPGHPRHQEGTALNGGSDTKTYCSEFYRYHTRGLLAGKWDFLSIDTAASGGPPLVFDHQMVMDSEAQVLYVFGGRVVDGDWDVPKYAGLYSYTVSTSKWKLLQNPTGVDSSSCSVTIPPRYGHSMVFDPIVKLLYIFAGQREDRFLSDMYSYDIKTSVATEVFANFSAAGGPEACFTQRAVIDPSLKEFYIFCGLTRTTISCPTHGLSQKAVLKDRLHNWVYRYDTRPGRWTQILRMPDRPATERPMPRFAHQVVYNPRTKEVFLHGGNAGISRERMQDETDAGVGGHAEDEETRNGSEGKDRLDDFWKMELKRPGPEEVIRQCRFMIRKQQFREMCEETPAVKSLSFLQNEVASVVDHQNKQEEDQFRALLTHLLSPSSQLHSKPSSQKPTPKPPITRLESPPSNSVSSSSSSSALEHEGVNDGSMRPRKRSRSERDGEERSCSISSGESGVWTSELPNIRGLRDITDPAETLIRCERMEKQTKLTGERYSQRTEVFEGLLKFVKDGEKQPDESLLDLVENDKTFDNLGWVR